MGWLDKPLVTLSDMLNVKFYKTGVFRNFSNRVEKPRSLVLIWHCVGVRGGAWPVQRSDLLTI